jgi:hypothetical protein
MIVTGQIIGSSIDFITGKAKLELSINEKHDFKALVDDMGQVEKLSIEIKPYRKRRSLDANALCWKLCTEIANIIRTDKESVYLEMLKRYGQSDIVSVSKGIDVKPYFKYYEKAGEGRVNGKEFTHYKVYQGSSEYDTRFMSIFLDGIVSEAKAMGIQVLSSRDLSLLKEEWGR